MVTLIARLRLSTVGRPIMGLFINSYTRYALSKYLFLITCAHNVWFVRMRENRNISLVPEIGRRAEALQHAMAIDQFSVLVAQLINAEYERRFGMVTQQGPGKTPPARKR